MEAEEGEGGEEERGWEANTHQQIKSEFCPPTVQEDKHSTKQSLYFQTARREDLHGE